MIRKFKFFEGLDETTFIFQELNMVSTNVEHGQRTLRAIWSPQQAEDLHTHHGIDAEAELTRILSQEWANEIDREVIRIINEGQRA